MLIHLITALLFDNTTEHHLLGTLLVRPKQTSSRHIYSRQFSGVPGCKVCWATAVGHIYHRQLPM